MKMVQWFVTHMIPPLPLSFNSVAIRILQAMIQSAFFLLCVIGKDLKTGNRYTLPYILFDQSDLSTMYINFHGLI